MTQQSTSTAPLVTPVEPERQAEGTGRSDRVQPYLDPQRAPILERTVTQMLETTRHLGRRLAYVDDRNEPAGAWEGFPDSDLDLQKVATFVQSSEAASLEPDEDEKVRRPHVALFLAFLGLLSRVQDSLNTLTGRHLDFYYRRVLGMRPRPAVPDQVHLLFEPAQGTEPAWIPAGTQASAGPDSRGNERIYATRRDLLANGAQIAEIRKVRVEWDIVDFATARARRQDESESLPIRLLEIALGDPSPGGALPAYDTDSGRLVDKSLLEELQEQIQFLGTSLHLKAFELHDLMKLKERRDLGAGWLELNKLLEKAGQARDTSFVITPEDSRDFDANLEAAVGPLNFAGLPEVESIYDLYVHRMRDDAQAFIQEKVYFSNPDDFAAMMHEKIRIDAEWGEIRRLLGEAARRKNPDSAFPSDSQSTSFDALFDEALQASSFDSLENIDDLDAFYSAILRLESYFYLSIPEIALVLESILAPNAEIADQPWAKVDDLLIQAHRQKLRARRRTVLREQRSNPEGPRSLEDLAPEGLAAMARYALGETDVQRDPVEWIDLLKPFVAGRFERTYLEAVVRESESPDWDRLERIVEAAWRKREGLPEPVPKMETWMDLHAASGLTTEMESSSDSAGPRDEAVFGEISQDPERAPQPLPGWAVSSPSLLLSEGDRTIDLTLSFEPESFDTEALDRLLTTIPSGSNPPTFNLSASHPWKVELSTEQGWLEPVGSMTVVEQSPEILSREILVHLEIPPSAPALVPLPEKLRDEQTPGTSLPVLRLSLRRRNSTSNDTSNEAKSDYALFRRLRLSSIQLKVEVSGVQNLVLQNDQGVLNPAQPFEPFGFNPTVGSRLMLTHPELVNRPLDSVTLKGDWMGAPENPVAHYKNYGLGSINFNTDIQVVERRQEKVLKSGAVLFDDSNKGIFSCALEEPSELADLKPRELSSQENAGTETLGWSRYLQLRLKAPDFQHSTYPIVASAKSLELTRAIQQGETVDPAKFQVNPPYTPKLSKLKLGYSSTVQIPLSPVTPSKEAGPFDPRIYHLHPFGYGDPRVDALPSPSSTTENQQYSVEFLPSYDHEGELYLGLQGLNPSDEEISSQASSKQGRTISILFQATEGSGDPDAEPSAVTWSRLDGERFVPLEKHHIHHDSTERLTKSGLLQLEIPPGRPGTLLPRDLTWLRATVSRGVEGMCRVVGFHTQAMVADRVTTDGSVTENTFDGPLSAESVTDLVEPNTKIAAVRQPYNSEGGRSAESAEMFYTRVAERLRHKGRAVNPWDYERLVLDRFPQIYKAMCIPGHSAHKGSLGEITLVVVPDFRDRVHFNAFEPKVSLDLLRHVHDFLSSRMPMGSSLKVRNPRYQQVRTRFVAHLRDPAASQVDEGFYLNRLNEELDRFLSPWAYGEGDEIPIGGRIHAHDIIDFLDRRPYVDYVTDLTLFTLEGDDVFRPVAPQEDGSYFVDAKEPGTILVSGRNHLILSVPETGYEESSWTGIGFMKIELDFIIA